MDVIGKYVEQTKFREIFGVILFPTHQQFN